MSKYGPLMGPFIASEIGRGMHKNNRSITALDISHDQIGDEGAEAFAGVIEENPSLTALRMGGNGISGRGGTALLKALRSARKGGALRELHLEGNTLSPELHAAIQQQLLLNNLPRLFREGLTGAPPAASGKGGHKGGGKGGRSARRRARRRRRRHQARAAAAARRLARAARGAAGAGAGGPPSEGWLTEGHAAALLVEIVGVHAASLRLDGCSRFRGAGLAGLAAPMPPPSPLGTLRELRLSRCEVDDAACAPSRARSAAASWARSAASRSTATG